LGWLPDVATRNRKLPLHYAVVHATPRIVALLLGTPMDEVGMLSSLHLVAKFGTLMYGGCDSNGVCDADRAVKLAVSEGADVIAATDNGDTALIFAASSGTAQMVQLLIKRGAFCAWAALWRNLKPIPPAADFAHPRRHQRRKQRGLEADALCGVPGWSAWL